MKILIVTTYGFDPAFPSRPEQLQARALVRRGHRVVAHEYLDRRYPGQSTRHEWLDGVAVHRAATLGFFAPEALLRLLDADRPDVIHIHHMRSLLAYQTVQVARRLGVPTVLTPHGLLHDGDLVVDRERPLDAPLRFENLLLTPAQLLARLAKGAHPRRAVRNYCIHAPLRMIDHAVALSRHEASLLQRLGVAPERISVLPNAVDLSGFERAGAAQPLQINTQLVLFIGQLVPRKAYDLLARAMPLVLREVPAARFVFVSHNRQCEDDLRRLVAEGGAGHAFELRGRVSEEEKLALLGEAAVVAAPSRYEGFGIPLIEAQAIGAALVTSDVPACNELITHEHNGLLTAYGDPADLAAAIVRLLRDRALARRLGENGRREVFARYSADRLASDLEEIYASLI
ncbi:glycosyltransferase family 4 protein [Oscillochloris sp. ZM17-4]|uniref:glycosyltransferase family 4 protein n=1 Tax=Oscillochloris sp. ZM17-4 TaxID=2866714 RepID=UPI001C72DC1C|nr:glycosyltransferase family 4 protein [Oscillochloris sp. ZM17-4]MBX0327989.1 glycosyltransferase family 4 protein [Oscillochloris sp. ZM17-4]